MLDHVEPVIPLKEGFIFRDNGLPDWNFFVDRLFCGVEGFQVICNPCHDAKTQLEDTMRAHFNALRKAKLKEEKKNVRKNKKSI